MSAKKKGLKKEHLFCLAGLLLGVCGGYVLFYMVANTGEWNIWGGRTVESHNLQAEHGMLETDPEQRIPNVTLKAEADTAGGYNLQLVTQHFTFTPEQIGAEPVNNEGHAHLYVNGEKVARLYGPWFYLPDGYLKKGENVLRVTLNANDHSEWVRNGVHISSGMVLQK